MSGLDAVPNAITLAKNGVDSEKLVGNAQNTLDYGLAGDVAGGNGKSVDASTVGTPKSTIQRLLLRFFGRLALLFHRGKVTTSTDAPVNTRLCASIEGR